jgi:hypothetical protein
VGGAVRAEEAVPKWHTTHQNGKRQLTVIAPASSVESYRIGWHKTEHLDFQPA